MADVPEGVMARVKLGQGCEAKFFGFPDQPFSGHVRAISPVLSKERRSLRVLFAISDPAISFGLVCLRTSAWAPMSGMPS